MAKLSELKSILKETASITTRSSVVSPITYLILLMLIGLIFLVIYSAPFIIIKTIMGIVGALVLFWMYSYNSLRRSDVNSLRSERHLRLMKAMEKGLIGDDLIGLIKDEKLLMLNSGTETSTPEIEGENE